MKGKQMALPGAPEMSVDKVGYWLSPEWLWEVVRELRLDWDACPFPRPSGLDNLKESSEWGPRTYCNPPFEHCRRDGTPTRWARKAIKESQKGKVIGFITYIARTTDLNGDLLDAGAHAVVTRSVGWLNPAGKVSPFAHRTPCVFYLLGECIPDHLVRKLQGQEGVRL